MDNQTPVANQPQGSVPVTPTGTAYVPPSTPPLSTISPMPNSDMPASKSGIRIMIAGAVLLVILLGGSGYLYFKNMQKPKPVVQQKIMVKPTPAIIPTATPMATGSAIASVSADWKTYKANDISFQYPGDATIQPNPPQNGVIGINTTNLKLTSNIDIQNSRDAIMGTPPDPSKLTNWYDLTFAVYDNPQNIALAAIQGNTNGSGSMQNSFTKTEQVFIDEIRGMTGIWKSGDVGQTKDAVFNYNGRMYVFEMIGDDGYYSPTGEAILNKILSSAHFTK